MTLKVSDSDSSHADSYWNITTNNLGIENQQNKADSKNTLYSITKFKIGQRKIGKKS